MKDNKKIDALKEIRDEYTKNYIVANNELDSVIEDLGAKLKLERGRK